MLEQASLARIRRSSKFRRSESRENETGMISWQIGRSGRGKKKDNNDKTEGEEEAGGVRSGLKVVSSTAHDDGHLGRG